MSGQAASYYNEGLPQGRPQPNYGNYQQPNAPPAPYPQPNYPQPNYPQPNYQQPNYQQPNYQQPSYQQPTYQQPPPEPKPAPQYHQNVPESGYNFDQAFKIEKPKWNDLWAGLLVSLAVPHSQHPSKLT